MPYDEKLADRIRQVLPKQKAISERKMFGGIAFMLGGNMCCGVAKDLLMARIGPEGYERALREPYVQPMDFTGRPLRGFVYVSPAGYQTDESLESWVGRAVRFASSLPPKTGTV